MNLNDDYRQQERDAAARFVLWGILAVIHFWLTLAMTWIACRCLNIEFHARYGVVAWQALIAIRIATIRTGRN